MNTKTKIAVLESIKWILVAVLALFLLSMISGNSESAAPFSTVQDSVISVADLSPMQEADNQIVKRLYGLNPGDYEGLICYTPTTNMGAEEILLVKLADMSQQAAVTAAIEARVATQLDAFEGYAIEQYEMLQNCCVEVQGNYILLVVAADPAPVRQAFLDAL